MLLVIASVVIALLFHPEPSQVPEEAGPAPLPDTQAPMTNMGPRQSPDRAVIHPTGPTPPDAVVHPEGVAFGSGQPPDREIELLMTLLRAYRDEFGGFPTGEDNPQFLNAMAGGNPGAIWFLPRPHPRIDAEGRLLDPWGAPYFFHAVSRDYLEIRSAGPDRELFTGDDLVRPKPRP